ncbi:MAG TPA: penicillin-binding transpeptidase domain-containing protein [Methylomusa anaerophila]|uniref:beta-lactamase n=1 Tax=Methylomusa anaerophila TaxID=1930071 RepID=A0A348AJB5_9FIRM|nr:penicillin-binding transpeptidase domain-containing protein [Methylomusa anaerophila]BBB91163.1 methicillin resistance mecR1 protein [Methylomusa anaerophila]HML89040.1 penicillin-binding transpeptidase domain-containing protein [Methylomusa anaerophila]
MKRWFLVLLTVIIINSGLITGVNAAALVEKKEIGKYFTEFTTGTFVMYDEANDQYVVFNEPQSIKRLSPCSTFKIYNSLAGLETGVLDQEDVFTLFKWNGKQYAFPAWNHDQTLASATRDSVVWYFQELASRVGTKRMQAFLDKIGYGNRDISGGLTTFWLRSSLQISASEQVDLLHRLYSEKLPVSPQNVAIVKKNITLSEDNGVRLMGKTGSGFQDDKWLLGWFVGCVEKQGNRYFFATNIEAPDGATGGKAREITKLILKDLQVL